MAFRFRLQSVLRYKEKVEDDRKLEMVGVAHRGRPNSASSAALDADRERVRAEVLSGMAGRGGHRRGRAMGCGHAEWLDELGASQAEVIAELASVSKRSARRSWRRCRTGRRSRSCAIGTRHSYDAEQLHAEQTLMDELSTSRYKQRPDAAVAAASR